MSLAAVSYASLIVKEFLALPLWLSTKNDALSIDTSDKVIPFSSVQLLSHVWLFATP